MAAPTFNIDAYGDALVVLATAASSCRSCSDGA